METLKINILSQDAMAILKGMEQAGFITMPKKENKKKESFEAIKGQHFKFPW